MLVFKIIRLILLMISCYGWIAFITEKKIKVEFAVMLFVSGTGSVMFLAGILNIMESVCLLTAVTGFIFAVKSFIKNKFPVYLCSYGGIALIIFAIGLFAIVYGSKFIKYDNFSHWVVVAREILENNRFPNFQDTLITFQSYPTGSASFIYYMCKVSGIHSEWMMMYAQDLAIIGMLLPLFAFCKKVYSVILPAVTIVFILCCNVSISDIYVDTLLLCTGAAGVLFCIYYRKAISNLYLALVPVLIFVVSIKNSGVFFAVVILAYLLLFGAGKNFKNTLILLAITLGTIFLWKQHVALVFENGLTAKHSMSVANLSSTFSEKTKDDILLICSNYAKRVFTLKNEFLYFVLGIFALLAFVWKSRKKYLSHMVKVSAFCLGVYVVYQLSLLGMYLFSMPTNEAIAVGSYDRYHMTIVGFLVIIMLPQIMKIYISGVWATVIWYGSIVCAEYFSLTPDFTCLARTNWKATERYRYEKVIMENNVPFKSSYMILRSDEDDGYSYWFYRYYLDSDQVSVFNDSQLSILGEPWGLYEYIIVLDGTPAEYDFINNTLGIDSNDQVIKLSDWQNK